MLWSWHSPRRKVAAIAAAVLLSSSFTAAQPQPVAAASCHWGAYQIDTYAAWFGDYVRMESSVRFRIGYT